MGRTKPDLHVDARPKGIIWCTDCCRIGKLQCDLQDVAPDEPCTPCQEIIDDGDTRRVCRRAHPGQWPDGYYRGNVERKLRNAAYEDGTLPDNADGRYKWWIQDVPQPTYSQRPQQQQQRPQQQQQRPQRPPIPRYNQGQAPQGFAPHPLPRRPAQFNSQQMPAALDAYGQPAYNVYGYQQPSQADDARRLKERLDWEADKRRDEERRLLAEERRRWDESRLYAARSEGYGQFHMPSANPQPHQPQPQPQPQQPDIFLQTRQTLADQNTRLQAQTVQNEEVDIKDTLAELMKKITRTESKLGDLNASSRKRGAQDDGGNQTSSSRKPSESRGRSGRPTNRENFDASTWNRGAQSERASSKETQSGPSKNKKAKIGGFEEEPGFDLRFTKRVKQDTIEPTTGLPVTEYNRCVQANVDPLNYARVKKSALKRGDAVPPIEDDDGDLILQDEVPDTDRSP